MPFYEVTYRFTDAQGNDSLVTRTYLAPGEAEAIDLAKAEMSVQARENLTTINAALAPDPPSQGVP